MKILCLTSGKLKALMNRERFDLYEAMEKQGAIIYDLDKKNTYDYDLPILLENVEKKYGKIGAIIFEEPVWARKLGFNIIFKNSNKINLPKATFITDYWQRRSYLLKVVKKNQINIIISTHEASYPFIKKYLPNIEHILFIPFCIKKEQYKKYNAKKTIDIINAGAIHPLTPLRNRMFEILNKLKDEKNINYFYVDHPGKRFENKKAISGQAYIDCLCESYFAIASTTKYNLSVRKYYEIMAAGCTIIGNQTDLPEHELIRKNIVEINKDMTDEEISKIVLKAIRNKERYHKKALEIREKIIELADRENVSKKIFEFFKSRNVQVSIMTKNQEIVEDEPEIVLKSKSAYQIVKKKLRLS